MILSQLILFHGIGPLRKPLFVSRFQGKQR